MTIHHLGYLVKRAEESERVFFDMGFQKETDWICDPERKISVKFLNKDGYRVELIQPMGTDSPYYSLLGRFRNMVYHICYETENYEEADRWLRQNGFVCTEEPKPAIAFNNREVSFYAHPHMGMVELLITTTARENTDVPVY